MNTRNRFIPIFLRFCNCCFICYAKTLDEPKIWILRRQKRSREPKRIHKLWLVYTILVYSFFATLAHLSMHLFVFSKKIFTVFWRAIAKLNSWTWKYTSWSDKSQNGVNNNYFSVYDSKAPNLISQKYNILFTNYYLFLIEKKINFLNDLAVKLDQSMYKLWQ